MTYNTCPSGRNSLAWLLCAVLLGLAACVQVGGPEGKVKPIQTVFPEPPDEPRFVYERSIYGSDNVVPQKEEALLKQLLTGESESGERLRKPYAIAVHRGRIFVSDTVARVVKVFDMPEGRYFKIGEKEDSNASGTLTKPMGLDVDENGNLYVADVTPKFIMIYDRDGNFLRKIGGPDFFDRLTSVTVDKKGERLYVVDIGGVKSENHRVRVFDAQKGNHLFDIGKRGSGPGEFNLPRDTAIDKDNNLYVVDGGNFRIQVFNLEGKFLRTFGAIGLEGGSFARPKEVQTDPAGNVYVIDAAFGNFQIFNQKSQLLMFIGTHTENDGPAHYMLPSGITVDENGRIYVVDQWFKKIDIFRPFSLGANSGFLAGKKK